MTRIVLNPTALLPFLALTVFGCTNKPSGDDTFVVSDADSDGFTVDQGDCDDTDATVNPDAAEVWYDGVDQNCDGADDFDQDGDSVDVDTDCDDTNSAVNPNEEDVCDGIDNNCDGTIDEGAEVVGWEDADQDGYGNPEAPVSSCGGNDPLVADNDSDCDDTNADIHPNAEEACDATTDMNCDGSVGAVDNDGDGVVACEECDDSDPNTFPGAPEVCDGHDNDCNGTVDDNASDASSWYADADADGYGDDTVSMAACAQPDGYTANGGDCNDADPAYNPGVVEDCASTVDLNCDGSVGYEDADGDGYAACEECNDADASAFPGGTEVCDGADNDCNGTVDDSATDAATFYVDADADGFGSDSATMAACSVPAGYAANDLDCDDGAINVNPDAADICDSVDNDCDGTVDNDAAYYGTYYADADADTYGDASTTASACSADPGFVADASDCDDTDGAINPAGTEVCDGADNDCDGTVDIGATDGTSWYTDADGDGHGAGTPVVTCTQPAGTSFASDDCDDANAAAVPGGTEVCDGADNDCNGTVDDGATDAGTYYVDLDGDGYGDASVSLSACGGAPAGYVADATDCNDGSSAAHPGAVEACDGIDNDCDGSTDEAGSTGESTYYADADADSYGDAASSISACSAPSGYVTDTTDCDDTDSASHPGAAEVDDGADNDCDKWVDEDFVSKGDIIISEVTRQPYGGGSSTNTDAQWFEVYNTSSRTVDLSYWYFLRSNSSTSVDAFFVDPDHTVTIAPGDYAVFCKTDNYESSTVRYPLLCDYVWGDETQPSTYSGLYHDNTFNLQRDLDRLAFYVGGGSSTGKLIDDVTWTYSSTSGYWPRDATRSMSLDPAFLNGTSNDSLANWCSTPNTSTYQWWDSTTYDDYGTPGGANYDCP